MAAAAGAYPALEDRHVKDTFRLFDVDGTLTPARRTISLEMLQLLSQLRHNCWRLRSCQQEQLGTSSTKVSSLFDFCFAENGLAAIRLGKSLLTIASLYGSPVGHNASVDERDKFEAYIRKDFVEALKKEFPDYGLRGSAFYTSSLNLERLFYPDSPFTSERHSLNKATAENAVELTGNSIRYNGVYVATFKPARRAFHASAPKERDHHFDTLKFVQRLKDEGFSEEQAVAMMRVLNDVIQESIQNLTRTMVLREDTERSTYTQKVDFAKLRSELLNADSTEAQLTRSSHEKIAADLAKLNSRLRDEIGRTQASVRLDLNLEKGRIREEANGQEMRIKETETRIEQEVAGLRERVEAVKFSTLQWLMGVCTGTAALILGAWRLFM
ncbi:hypothetical protein ETB97_003055 [Aspergillus alliaceus]|uniref:Phosphomannomutase n=1 Tax=Petromyces alliaceus TaxID=209559 RepID=A0A8H6EAK7_PETAA|nr:hypothetical protein ETB97_003055 [Aspergillus burnettii]